MTNLSVNNSPKPLSAPGGAVNLSSGVAPGQIFHKLMISYSVAGNLQITMLDGTTTTAIAMPINTSLYPFVIDCQFQSVTWTGTAVAVGFYRIDG
jgi:hypothetical protein